MTGPSGEPPAEAHRFPASAELRAAAMAYTGHGWPVLRGTYLANAEGGPPRWCGRSDAVGLRPVDDDWVAASTVRAAEAARWWSQAPYNVLVACGQGVDCIELPSPTARRLITVLHEAGLRGPAMLTPIGTLVLFVQTHRGPRPMLVSASLRSTDSWVPVPPTSTAPPARGPSQYRWLPDASPGALGWALPELLAVNAVISAAARAVMPRRGNTDSSQDPQ